MAIQEAWEHGRSGRRREIDAGRRRVPSWQRSGGNGGWRGGIEAHLDEKRLAAGLGWFSIGLGLAELVAPSALARFIGVRDDGQNRRVLRALGLRELTSGVGILSNARPAGWMWSRVAGDVMDLALLGNALTSDETRRDRVAGAAAAVVGVAILDLVCAERLSEHGKAETGSALPDWTGTAPEDRVHVTRAITIGRPAEEVYRYWRELQNLPRIMRHLASVEIIDERRSHWRVNGPLGRTVEWDSEITEDQPNERIAWRSLEGGDIDNSGSVSFTRASGGRGTAVRVEIEYRPPGARLGATVAKLLGQDPGERLSADLHAFKQLMETGEVILSDATAKGWGAAQPPVEWQPR